MKIVEPKAQLTRENITIEFTPDEVDAIHAVVGRLVTGNTKHSPRRHTNRLYALLKDYCSHSDNKLISNPFIEEYASAFNDYKEKQND